MTDVLLATSAEWPVGEPGSEALDDALARRGLSSRWARWDDPAVDWAAAGLVCVRSTWDYETRLAEFLAWADGVGPTLVHGAAVFRWNTDKAYLRGLASAGLPVVPTDLADDATAVADAVRRLGTAVVKPRVGAGGRGVAVVRDGDPPPAADTGPWVVQPLLRSVQEEGEISVFVIDGASVSQVAKQAAPGDIRVHPHWGGSERPTDLTEEAAGLAADAVAAASAATGADLVYARVDLLRDDAGTLLVSEVEVTEPGLYLDVVPANGDALADALRARL